MEANITMGEINFIAICMLIFGFIAFYYMKSIYRKKETGIKLKYKKKLNDNKEDTRVIVFWLILAFSILIRCIYGGLCNYHSDISCFNYWACHVYDVGFGKFYEMASFADYPPGYMYILFLVQCVRELFNIESYSTMGLLLLKSPAIICDIVTAVFIYKISKKYLNDKMALVCYAVYILNPVVILNSAVWGQVDSVLTLGLILMCYYVYTDRAKYAYVAYFAAVMVKPQAFIFTPIVIYALIDEIFRASVVQDKQKTRKKILEQFVWGFSSLFVTIAAMLPFGSRNYLVSKAFIDSETGQITNQKLYDMALEIPKMRSVDSIGDIFSNIGAYIEAGLLTLYQKYFDTMSSYGYATVNAYNIWGMFGLDWKSQEHTLLGVVKRVWETKEYEILGGTVSLPTPTKDFDVFFGMTYQNWGTIAILTVCLIATVIACKNHKSRERYILIASFISIAVFMLAVRMHERYSYPGVILLLILFIVTKRKSAYLFYLAFSIGHFYNGAHVLFKYDPTNFDARAIEIILISVLQVGIFIVFMIYIFRYYLLNKSPVLSCVNALNESILIDGSFGEQNIINKKKDNKNMSKNVKKDDLKDKKDKKENKDLKKDKDLTDDKNQDKTSEKNEDKSENKKSDKTSEKNEDKSENKKADKTSEKNEDKSENKKLDKTANGNSGNNSKKNGSTKNNSKNKKASNNVKKNYDSNNKEKTEIKNFKDFVNYLMNRKWFTAKTVERSERAPLFTKYDWIIMSVITVVYAVIALYNLGDKDAPQSFHKVEDVSTHTISIELPENTTISKIAYYLGNYEERDFDINSCATTKGVYTNSYTTEITNMDGEKESVTNAVNNTGYIMNSVFCWSEWDYDAQARYLDITYIANRTNSNIKDNYVIGELVIIDQAGNIVRPVNADDKEIKALFDEQDKYPESYSYRNSTYFDEIYHARTAYEFLNDLYSYENTHPPLGKAFIALGISIFGMCPFGWRIAGTVFGILMVPFLYLFGKLMFKRTDLATVTCLLFTFDFMHFAQSRIATIDVYVTFFVILMYLFMYKYYRTSFYDTKLWKTFIPLGLCAISMGLGCASKWTGCYAGAGLAVIFFIVMYQRIAEYRYAKLNPAGKTNGISHEHIIKVFKKYFWGTIGYAVVMFIGVAGTIYTLSYIPFVSGNLRPDDKYVTGRLVNALCIGEDAIFPVQDSLIGKMLGNVYTMFSYHSSIEFEHPYSSRWFEWPLMIRPIWYYSGVLEGDMREGISAFGNPLVWWIGLVAFGYMVYRIFKNKDKIALFIVIGYLAQYLPWMLVARTTFIYHYMPSVAFVVLMIAYSIYHMIKEQPQRKKYMYIYVALVVILFIMFYPVLSGATVDKDYVSIMLRWFESWQLLSY